MLNLTNFERFVVQAIKLLKPEYTSFSFSATEIVDWQDNVEPLPTKEEIDAKIVELVAEYDAQEYARNRKAEYPSVADLVVALYDTDDKSAIETKRAAVKAKYPKP